jgi:hypothetical protein
MKKAAGEPTAFHEIISCSTITHTAAGNSAALRAAAPIARAMPEDVEITALFILKSNSTGGRSSQLFYLEMNTPC